MPRGLVIAGLIAAALAVPAQARAADLLAVATSSANVVPIAGPEFDWNGFYAGVYGVTRSSALDGVQFGLGLDLGVDARFDMVLVGGEVAIEGLTGTGGDAAYLQSVGKLGLALTDEIALYGAAGAGVSLAGGSETDLLIGGGVTFAVADSVSLDARYLHAIPVTGANPKDQLSLGANFHF